MADPQYDAYRDLADMSIPDPDVEGPESSEDRYRDVINDEAERLPPEEVEPITEPTVCPECSVVVVLGGPEAEECEGCGRDIHVQCRSFCGRCHDHYCSSCLVGEICSGCYDDRRSGEYSRGGTTREV